MENIVLSKIMFLYLYCLNLKKTFKGVIVNKWRKANKNLSAKLLKWKRTCENVYANESIFFACTEESPFIFILAV